MPVAANNELHLPGFGVAKGRGNVDLFAFIDTAALHLRVDDDGVAAPAILWR
jgi:hypothetical protein